jgi:hypothetical protein
MVERTPHTGSPGYCMQVYLRLRDQNDSRASGVGLWFERMLISLSFTDPRFKSQVMTKL